MEQRDWNASSILCEFLGSFWGEKLNSSASTESIQTDLTNRFRILATKLPKFETRGVMQEKINSYYFSIHIMTF